MIAVRLLLVLLGLGLWGLAIYGFLRAASWLVRQPFLYAGTIRDFEARPLPPGAVLFVGSSTIRLWESLARDFPAWPVVNRGFGGAVVSQVVHFATRLVPTEPAPRAIVFYCGGNDLAWGVSVARVLEGIERFVAIAKERAPGSPVYLLSVGKTPSRFLSWRRVAAVNAALPALAERLGARYVDVCTPMLDARGRPQRGLFVFDGIHPSAAGYAVWTSVLRPRLEADLRRPNSPA